METADKDFKVTVMTTFKKIEEKIDNFIWDLESILKNKIKVLELKNILSDIK